jgi:predicted Zn-dependent peptidase
MLEFYQSTLSNGLTIVGEKRQGAVSTALGYFVKTGSRDEKPEVAGVSHFLEHMMFKGTQKRDALKLTFDLAAIGAQANAFTTVESTVYYGAVLPEYLPDLFDILSDMMRSVLDPGEFATEKKVILEEIALYKDRPSYVLFEEAMHQFFLGHSVGNSVLGSVDTISALSVEQMRDYFNRRYNPQNMVLSVAGQFNWEEVLVLAEQHCSSWQGFSVSRDYAHHTPAARRVERTKSGINTSYLSFIAAGPSIQEDDSYSMQVLSTILGDSSGSKMFWQLVDKGLCDTAYMEVDEMDHAGMVYSYASCAPEGLAEVEKIVRGIFANPLDFSDEDLERAKTKYRTRVVLQGESSMQRMISTGMEWMYEGRHTSLEQELAKYAAVDRSSIEAALKKYPLSPLTEVILVP